MRPGLGLPGTPQSSQLTVRILREIKLRYAHLRPRILVGVVEGFSDRGCHRMLSRIPLVFYTHRILLVRTFVWTLTTARMDCALAVDTWLLWNLFGKTKNASIARLVFALFSDCGCWVADSTTPQEK